MNLPEKIQLNEKTILEKVTNQINQNQLRENIEKLKDKNVEDFLGFDKKVENELTFMYQEIEKGNSVYYLIYQEQTFIGIFYIYEVKPKYKRANMSLGIIPDKRGHILTLKVIQSLLNQLFECGFQRLAIEIEDANDASLRMIKHLEKIGFVYEGKLRDNYGENIHSNIWSILKRDFHKQEKE